MNAFKIAWRSGMGRPGKTGLWILLVAFFSLASVVVFFVGDMADNYEKSIIQSHEETVQSAFGQEAADQLQVDVEAEAWLYSGVAGMLFKIAGVMLVGMYLTMGIVVVLMSVMWMRDHGHDMGIWVILGQSRGRIVARLLLEMLLVSLLGMIPGTGVGLVLVNRFGAGLILSLREHLGFSFYMSMQEMDSTMLYTKLPWQRALLSGNIVLGILMVVVMISCIVAVRRRPAALLEQER